MSFSVPIIIYRYNASPYSHKIDNVLAVKGVQHEQVRVAATLPRPEITEQLGIAYRRIPILAIGNDVYCDTGLIANTIERRFPVSKGYGTIFPPSKHGGGETTPINTFSKFYAENALFPLASSMIPWNQVPASLLKDRSAFTGRKIDPKVMANRIPLVHSTLLAHLSILEEQLSDSREWLLDTTAPSLADISVHFILAWAKSLPAAQSVLDEKRHPKTFSWLARVTDHVKDKRLRLGQPPKLSGPDAASKIFSSTHESYDRVGFDDKEAARWKVKRGDIVDVAPDDTARDWPTTGKLVALSHEELILEVKSQNGILRVHFPRLGYTLRATPSSKL